MKLKKAFATAVALLALQGAQAQADIAGRLMGQSYFDITDMLNFAQTDYTSGTSRSAAMGGAFTSLGADLSSMSINPAGLGMYQSSDLGVTLSILNNRTAIQGIGAPVNQKDISPTTMKFNNIGFAFGVWEGSGRLTNINLGISYNTVANYNSTASYEVVGQPTSIADIFRNQLYQMKDAGITQQMMNSSSDPFNNPDIYLSEWGSVLAYQTELVFGEEDGSFTLDRSLSDFAKTNSYLTTRTRGGAGDFELSVGGNVSNILYFGASLGVRSVHYTENNYYEEAYSDNTAQYPIEFMMYDQNVRVNGSGFNGKFGLTVRPVGGLRIGVAVHTPTYLSLSKHYSAAMRACFVEEAGYNDVTKESPTNSYSYNYTTPARLLAGASYTFGQWAVFSADYECVWYNGMRLKSVPQDIANSYKQQIKQHYKAGHNFRLGLEIKPTSWMALRGGFGTQGDFLRKVNGKDGAIAMFDNYDNPVVYKTLSGSAGIGFRFNSVYLDLAYVYNKLSYTPYMMFYYQNGNDEPLSQVGTTVDGEDILLSYKQSVERHGFMLTLGVRF
ncbi:MAG: hypothetical protein IJ014_01950 [Rikenellaceae bacterium]|nr:hypothetical protein [Rikenellaceae bacterium]